MHLLFANTGVQIICVPLRSGRRFTTAQIGYGWQYCRTENHDEEDPDGGPVRFPYIQWQIVQSHVTKLFLAVDTSLGDPEVGYFCDPSSLAGDYRIVLADVLDLAGDPLQGLPEIEICLREATATAGEAKPVHMIVDFGNSRTGALLLEMSGEVSQSAEMMPFELPNRYTLDSFDDEGEAISKPSARWFASRTMWCNAPYLNPMEMPKVEYYRETKKGILGKKQITRERETYIRPNLFDDMSMARMGHEVDDVSQIMHAQGDFRMGLSSPKRYLWADDESWLEGAFWYMADPHDRCGTGTFASKIQGPLLRFLHEDDRDFVIEEDDITEEMLASDVPVKPRHAPRSMMVLALLEMLSQAYVHINSPAYRSRTTDPARSRELRSLTMTYPSGMFQPERERFIKQAEKAINIFYRSLGKNQRTKPSLSFSIDEASAVHLTYIWSELKMLGQDPRLWFAALGRDHSPPKSDDDPDAPDADGNGDVEGEGAAPAARRRNRGRVRPRPGGARRGGGMAPGEEDSQRKGGCMRIACIDIGGGTTDMMIAQYDYQPGIDDSIQGQVLHQDGISVAGDQLVKRLLEKVIVPAFAEGIGLEEEDVQLLFGPEVPKNRGFTSQRITWMNRLFVPLAEAYLDMAVEGIEDEEISHNDPDIIDPVVVESLEQMCSKLRGPGYYDVTQETGLTYNKVDFEDVVHEVFDDVLFDFCSRIVDHEADVILLAGQPSKISYIQELVRMYVPLPDSRVIPMFNHYAGNWYPYQDSKGHSPGMIVDPKSAVVVGAAIEFMAKNGMLPQFKFQMRGKQLENTYYWGIMTESTGTIREDRILFEPADENTRDEWTEFTTIAQRVVLARKMTPDEEVQAQPIYALKMETGNRIGQTEMTVRVRRVKATDEIEEYLEVESVTGIVAEEPAVLDENVTVKWRTLADERYFLDTGGLDNLELDN